MHEDRLRVIAGDEVALLYLQSGRFLHGVGVKDGQRHTSAVMRTSRPRTSPQDTNGGPTTQTYCRNIFTKSSGMLEKNGSWLHEQTMFIHACHGGRSRPSVSTHEPDISRNVRPTTSINIAPNNEAQSPPIHCSEWTPHEKLRQEMLPHACDTFSERIRTPMITRGCLTCRVLLCQSGRTNAAT